MVQTATVISIDGKYAEIEVSRKAMCDGCHKMGCGSGCSMSGIFSSGGKMTAKAINEAGAIPGDTVEIETSDREVLSAATAVFILPVITGGIFYAFALLLDLSVTISAISTAAGFVLPFLFLKIAEKRHVIQEPKLLVRRIIKNDGKCPDEID